MNPNATNHSISHFKKYYDDGSLDLSPSFQRKPVWSDSQASYLIDSILNDLPVPEIFVRSVTDEEGRIRLEVVDGQQRLRSIIRFFQGDLEISGENVTATWEGKSWSDLEPDVRTRFWAFKLVTRELSDATDTEVRDMFRRLNANQSNLNAQELRHSQYNGEFIQAVEDLANEPWWMERQIVTAMQVRRMIDVEFVSELLVGLINGPLDKKNGLDDFYQEYDEDFPDREYWVDLFHDARALSERLVGGNFKKWKTKTEFYSLFLAAGGLVYEEVELSAAKVKTAQRKLELFRTKVDEAKKRGASGKIAKNVSDYADAASRASTDRGRRELRINTIRKIVEG